MSGTTAPGGARPWAHRVGVVALVLVALATGRAITHSFPVEGRIEAPFVRGSTVGEPVRLRYADVEVGAPAGARELVAGGSTLSSPGVWLVVPVRITARGEPRTLGYAAVRGSDGTLYVAGGFGRGGFAPGTAQPGVPREADVAIELPADAVAGAHLVLALDPYDHRRDDLADIDLGLTQADAERWTDGAPPVTFRDAADVGATASADASGDGS